ncbi:MAG: DUF3256 family protein [Prevotellaceae bacterium]|nr:DUF3256 family protein [Prevotellaceae bacterium]
MSKLSVLFIALALLAANGASAQSIEDVYITMPDRINPLLTQTQRVELLKYHKLEQGDSVINQYGTGTVLLELDTVNRYINIRNTDVSQIEIQLFPYKKEYVIGLIHTFCGNICHSTIRFFNRQWEEITVHFPHPHAKDWIDADKFDDEAIDMYNFVNNLVDIDFIEMHFRPAEKQIIAENNTPDFLSKKDKEFLQPFLKQQPFIYHYDGVKWVCLNR